MNLSDLRVVFPMRLLKGLEGWLRVQRGLVPDSDSNAIQILLFTQVTRRRKVL